MDEVVIKQEPGASSSSAKIAAPRATPAKAPAPAPTRSVPARGKGAKGAGATAAKAAGSTSAKTAASAPAKSKATGKNTGGKKRGRDETDDESDGEGQDTRASSSKRSRFSEAPSVLSDASFGPDMLGEILLSLELISTGVSDMRAALAGHLRRGVVIRGPK